MTNLEKIKQEKYQSSLLKVLVPSPREVIKIYSSPPPPFKKGGGGSNYVAYDHKTQSFMKNRGQQKCLDKALWSFACHKK